MRELQCGVLVVGGGAAGTRAAYEAKRAHPELEVCLAVTGRYETGGSTNMVASEALGINAPFNCEGDGDDPEIYLRTRSKPAEGWAIRPSAGSWPTRLPTGYGVGGAWRFLSRTGAGIWSSKSSSGAPGPAL